ncbi:RNA helicase [Ascosphaera atra]|nr:RNA helicase [Ascosphaera atra]
MLSARLLAASGRGVSVSRPSLSSTSTYLKLSSTSIAVRSISSTPQLQRGKSNSQKKAGRLKRKELRLAKEQGLPPRTGAHSSLLASVLDETSNREFGGVEWTPEEIRNLQKLSAVQRRPYLNKDSKEHGRSESVLDRPHPAEKAPVGRGFSISMRKKHLNSKSFTTLLTNVLTSIRLEHQAQHLGASPEKFDDFSRTVHLEAQRVARDFSLGVPEDPNDPSLGAQLRRAYLDGGEAGIPGFLRTAYQRYLLDDKYSDLTAHTKPGQLLDFTHPAEWFPLARELQREIHLHVGPTNSGKTYHALKRLEEAKSGFYAGPLRLLAHEVYSRFNAKGIPCGLVTGDEVRYPTDCAPRIFSNTVEMVPLGQEVDVGVIDEIQMIADDQRGWAWTRAVLGARAKELHLCGEERTVKLIEKLATTTGDKVHVHRYKRLNELRVMKSSLKGNLSRLEKGDCLVAFSRLHIHSLKEQIEKSTGRRCAIVYGSLPAEIRSQQADLFNDPENDYDFLVASDAIGMGLNLSVKRIIFETVVKRLPQGYQRLAVPHIKQIAGRAGRYRVPSKSGSDSEAENIGLVTSLEDVDLPFIREALATEPEDLTRAGLLATDHQVRAFADHFDPETPFAYVLHRLHGLARLNHDDYFLCGLNSHQRIGEMLEPVGGLTVSDRLVFAAAPIANKGMVEITRAFARCVENNTDARLLEIPEINLDILNRPVSGEKAYLQTLEILHRSLVLYLWLSYRMGGVFTDRTLATHAKAIAEVKMDRALTEFSANRALRRQTSLRRQLQFMRQMEKRQVAMKNAGAATGTVTEQVGGAQGLQMKEMEALAEAEGMQETEEGEADLSGEGDERAELREAKM